MSFVDIHLHSGKKMLQTYKRKRPSSTNGLTQGIEKHGLPLDGSEAAALSPTNKAQHQKPEHDEEEIYAETITVNSDTSLATVCLKGGSTCFEGNAHPLKAPDAAVAQSPCSNLSNMETSESVGTVALNKASGLCRKMQVKLKQQPTPLLTFIRRNKQNNMVSGSNQDLGLSKVSKLGIENQAAVFKLSVDNDKTPIHISASGGIDIKEKPSLQNSQASCSCSNTLKDHSLEDANNTQPANDPSIESLIDDKSRRVSNEAMQMPDHRRKVELPCLNLPIASLDQCEEMDGLDLNKESVQIEPLSNQPSGAYLLQNEILRAPKDVTTLAVQEAPKNQYLQLFPETVSARGSEGEESLRLGTNTFSEQLSSRYPFLPIDPKIVENAYQNQECMQHLYSSASSLDQGSMLLRHKLIIGSILGQSTWSEEELDFLWVGVRRYGRNNWEAMLRDPRMQFSPWRSPRELAVRWDEEQIKLLSNICGSQTKSSKPRRRNNTRRKSGAASRRSKMNEEETLLSLGDLYVKPNVSDGLKQIQYQGSSRSKRQRLLYKESYLRQDTRLFQFHHPTSTGNVVNTSLPHWLQQVMDRTVSPSRVYLDGGGELCLQPTGTGSWGLQHHLGKQQNGLIIINSDSSSEETISDDNLS